MFWLEPEGDRADETLLVGDCQRQPLPGTEGLVRAWQSIPRHAVQIRMRDIECGLRNSTVTREQLHRPASSA